MVDVDAVFVQTVTQCCYYCVTNLKRLNRRGNTKDYPLLLSHLLVNTITVYKLIAENIHHAAILPENTCCCVTKLGKLVCDNK